jgi:hypothetical protein
MYVHIGYYNNISRCNLLLLLVRGFWDIYTELRELLVVGRRNDADGYRVRYRLEAVLIAVI